MRHWFRIFLVISMFIGLFSTASVKPTEAQTPPPSFEPERPEPCRPGEPCEDDMKERFVLPGEVPESEITAVGDTDDYGYTLSTTALNWIEISGDGINSGLSNTIYQTGAITMPFNFPFYENTYNKLYISRYGYLTFNDDGWSGYGWPIPYEQRPNNLIIPIGGGFNYNSGAAYYKAFGTTHFVIQWNNVQDSSGRVYTFEAILFPDGRIDFRYKTMPDTSQGYRCSSSGIENATGTDGLAFWQGCERPAASNTKVRFTRPGPSARVGVLPLYLG